MAKRIQEFRRRKEIPLWLSISAIMVLLAVAGLLVALAIENVSKKTDITGFATKEVANVAISSVNPSVEVEMTNDENRGSESPDPLQTDLMMPEVLIASNQEKAIRASVGECNSPGSIEFLIDSGHTWHRSEAFSETGATKIIRLIPGNGLESFVVALNSECLPQVFQTSDNGISWSAPISAVGTWYLNPLDPARVGAPGGEKMINCKAKMMAPTTETNVNVLCMDGQIISTTNGGQSWNPKEVQGDIFGLGQSEQFGIFISTETGDCRGISIIRDFQLDLNNICLGPEFGISNLSRIAATQYDNQILVWANGTQLVSRDGGQTWE